MADTKHTSDLDDTLDGLPHLADAERKQWLQNHADSIKDNVKYTRPLTFLEKQALKEEWLDHSKICIQARADKKLFNEQWKLTHKLDLEKEKQISKTVITGVVQVTETLYDVVDEEAKRVYQINGAGEVVDDRRARIHELNPTLPRAFRSLLSTVEPKEPDSEQDN